MIRALIFDLDNTLTDFMKMKDAAIEAGLDGMADAGLTVSREVLREHIWRVYDAKGIEYQQVFDEALSAAAGMIDPRVLSAGIVAYRRARESTLVLYPHVQYTLLGLLFVRAFFGARVMPSLVGCALLAVVAGFAIGIADEIFQAGIPGRVSSEADFRADALGVVLGVVAYALARRLRPD